MKITTSKFAITTVTALLIASFASAQQKEVVPLQIQSIEIKGPKRLVIEDIWLMNGDTPLNLLYRSDWHVGEMQGKNGEALFDGDDTTMCLGPVSLSNYVKPHAMTGFAIAVQKQVTVKDVTIQFKNHRGQVVDEVDLSQLADMSHARAYLYSFDTKKFTKLNLRPEPQQKHPKLDISTYIGEGLQLDFSKDSLPDSLEYTAENGEWTVENGRLRIKQGKGISTKKESGTIDFKDHTLKPGHALALDVDLDYAEFKSTIQQTIQLGDAIFSLTKGIYLTDPSGKEFIARSYSMPTRTQYTILFSRGEGANANTINWFVLGAQHDRSGSWTSQETLPEILPIKLTCTSEYQYTWWNSDKIDTSAFTAIFMGKQTKTPEHIATANEAPVFDKTPYLSRMWKLRKKNPRLPKLTLSKKYGEITDNELALFKAVVKQLDLPRTNAKNGITFGAGHTVRGMLDIFYIKPDKELLQLAANWCASMLEYRNGGKHYSINTIPAENWNYEDHPTPLDQVAPIWPHFMDPIIIDGTQYIWQDVTSAVSVPATMMYYVNCIAKYPQLHDMKVKLYDGREITHKQLSLEFIKATEETLDQFVKPYFIDKDNFKIERPWNRYAQLIETFHYLKTAYVAFKKDLGPDIDAKITYADNVVRAYLHYFLDTEENYTLDTIDVDGEKVAVASTLYAPKWRNWGAKNGEDLAHGTMEYGDLFYLYLSGDYKDILTPAQIRIFADNFYYRMFRGMDTQGRLKIANHYNGQGDDAGSWIPHPLHLWTSLVKQDMYDELMDAFIGELPTELDPDAYAFALALRNQFFKQGYGELVKFQAPEVVISCDKQVVKAGETISFTSGKSKGVLEAVEWDFNQDSKVDSTKKQAEYTFEEKGIYVVSLRAATRSGLYNYGFKTIVVE